jgi:DNA phosphorothioation-dependent restriction protein DptG
MVQQNPKALVRAGLDRMPEEQLLPLIKEPNKIETRSWIHFLNLSHDESEVIRTFIRQELRSLRKEKADETHKDSKTPANSWYNKDEYLELWMVESTPKARYWMLGEAHVYNNVRARFEIFQHPVKVMYSGLG